MLAGIEVRRPPSRIEQADLEWKKCCKKSRKNTLLKSNLCTSKISFICRKANSHFTGNNGNRLKYSDVDGETCSGVEEPANSGLYMEKLS